MTHPGVVEQRYLKRWGQQQSWGIGLVALAGLLWLWAGFQLFTPHHSHYGHYACSAPFNRDSDDVYLPYDTMDHAATERHDAAVACARDRDWPQPMAALLLSLPLAVTGAALLSGSRAAVRVHRLHADMARAEKEHAAS